MVFKVYNQNGKVKVTKLCGVMEQTMFSDIQEGEMVEIEVGTTQFTKSKKKKANAASTSFRKTIAALEFSTGTGIDYKEEALFAAKVLRDTEAGKHAVYEEVGRLSLEKPILYLQSAKDNQIVSDEEASRAIAVLRKFDNI